MADNERRPIGPHVGTLDDQIRLLIHHLAVTYDLSQNHAKAVAKLILQSKVDEAKAGHR